MSRDSRALLVTVAALLVPSAVCAQNGSWSQAGTGSVWNWGDAGNWTGGVIADGSGNTATFATAGLSAGVLINLDSPRTLGTLLFNNPTNSFGWTVGGSNTLTVGHGSVFGSTVAVNNAAITATIAAPLAGSFAKTGPGALVLSGNNTALTGFSLLSGRVGVTTDGSSNPLGTGTVTLAGGTLRLGDGSGYNQRMVVPVGTTFALSGVTATMDGGTSLANYTWYAKGENASAPLTGLPMGQTIASAAGNGIQYTFPTADTTRPNAMLLDLQHTRGRFALATPTSGLSTISFLTGSSNVGVGAGTIRPVIAATIHYTDGTPDATGLTFTSPDEFVTPTTGDSATAAVAANGRLGSSGYAGVVTPPVANRPPNLFDASIANPNLGSKVGSIDLSWALGSGGTQTAIHTVIFALGTIGAPIPVAGANGAQTFNNAVAVAANSTIDVQSPAGGTLGNLTIGSNQLNLTGVASFTNSTGFTPASSLTVGAVAMTGNPTFNVGDGLTMVTGGAFTDGGTARIVTKTGGGTLTAAAVSASLQAGTGVTVNAGTLNMNSGTAFGPSPAATINGGTLALAAAQNSNFGSLNGSGGSLVLNGNTVTLQTGGTASYAGAIADGTQPGGKLVMAGTGTQNLTGISSFTGGVAIPSGIVSAIPGALGTGAVTLSGGTLAAGLTHTVTGASFNATNWQLNGSASFPSAGVLQLFPAAGGTGSAWFKTIVPVGPFNLNFTLTNLIGTAGGGITVGFQSQGLTALGAGGSGLGYQGISPSAVMQLNLGSPPGGSSVGFLTNGQAPTGGQGTSPVNFGLQNQPINVSLTYDGTNANVTLVQGTNTFSTSQAFSFSVAGTTAYFGFTGGTGGVLTQSQISNFSINIPSYSGPGAYPNPVSVTAPSTIRVTSGTSAPTVVMGALTLAGTTLAVVPDPANPANQGYGLTFGGTTVTGNAAINVSNNGTGLTTLKLGALSGAGSLTVTGGPAINVAGGSLGGRLDIGASPLSLGGASLTVGSLVGSGPLNGNSVSPITLTVGGDNTSTGFGGVIANGSTGALSLVKTGTGTLALTGTNTYTGGTTISDGTLAVAGDASLGSGPVTISPLGTLQFTATTTTGRSFNLGNGTLAAGQGVTVTFNGSSVISGYLAGPGTFATSPTSAARFANMTARQSVALVSNNIADRFVNFSNGGSLTIATGSAGAVSLTGITIQSTTSSLTMNAQSLVNITDLSSFGTLTISPAMVTSGFNQTTLMTNVGASRLSFGGGSRTFVGTPDTAVFRNDWPDINLRGVPTFVAGIDLNGKNALVAGGLFVNNGYVEDSTNNFGGKATVIADFGSLVRGAGYFQNSVVTQNGGKYKAGNSPGSASFGTFVLGPGGVGNYVFDIDDATGTAGPSPDAAGHVSGWGLVKSINRGTAPGDFTWTATPASTLSVSLQTLLNPTTVGNDMAGPMDHFDPAHSYDWPAVEWTGTYAGPMDAATLNASTTFDLTGFANPVAGTFGWSLDTAGRTLSLTYTPSAVPEPGTLALCGLAAAVGWRSRRRFSHKGV